MPKPRILCLPGYTQNATIFSGRLGAIRKALKDTAELIFVDPPHVVQMPTESSSDFKDKFDSTASAAPTSDADTPRAWWFAETREDGTSDFDRFRGFDDTVVYLRELMEKHAPVQGIMGFSQGAATAAILAALIENPQLDPVFSAPPKDENTPWPPKPFEFAILSAGFLPLDPKPKAYFDVKPKTPTLHVLGRADTIVGEERSIPLTEAFVNARVEWHDGGHHTPNKASWRQFFKAYIEAFGDDGKGAEGVVDIPSPMSAPSAAEPSAVEAGGKL